ncbi:MAG: TrpB-like pyridoxal phosphate-dependent enzyme [Candidatus Hodarchaeota archaeon]
MCKMFDDGTKIFLEAEEMPKKWYNILADLPVPLPPPLNPGTGEPLGPEDLAPIFPMELIKQEVASDRYIDIPEEVLEIYKLWRPTPLIRAKRLEKALGTPAHIWYKYEGVSPPGSHKPNTSVAQAYYNMKEGQERLTTETGAGQWGSALALACAFFELECTVYMVKVSYYQKPYRRTMMEVYGAEVFASPSENTESGKKILAENPDHPGSLGVAISEAVEDAVKHDDTKYSLGSVLNHVLLHQTIVGQEAKIALEAIDEYPDMVIGCVGGGSNFSGLSFPFLYDKLTGKAPDLKAIAVEPTAVPTLTRGLYEYDFGDTAKLTPLVKMYTLGHTFVPDGIHAGGLRYHGDAPLLSLLVKEKIMDAIAYHQNPVFEAAKMFAMSEGIITAPETSHAVRAAIDEALKCKETGEEKVILFNCSGHGLLDLKGFEEYLEGNLTDFELPEKEIERARKDIPKVGQ